MRFFSVCAWVGIVATTMSCGTTVDRTFRTDDTNQTTSESTAVVAAPIITPAGGTFSGAQYVTIFTTTPGAQIRYTFGTADEEPTETSTLYPGEAITIDQTGTLRARAFLDTFQPSEISEAGFFIDGDGGNGNGNTDGFHLAKVEVEFAVDHMDKLRVVDGVMDLIHVDGARSENPIVRVTYEDGSTTETNPWNLDPFHQDSQFPCNFAQNLCVSSPLDLGIRNLDTEKENFIASNSIVRFVGRGSISVDGDGHVVVHDPQSSWSGYWFTFDYWYKVQGEE